jgi:hypothetical protein
MMDAQQGITLLIVAVAALFSRGGCGATGAARTAARPGAGCAGACGKPAQKNLNVRMAPQAKPLITLSAGVPPRRPVSPPHQQ